MALQPDPAYAATPGWHVVGTEGTPDFDYTYPTGPLGGVTYYTPEANPDLIPAGAGIDGKTILMNGTGIEWGSLEDSTGWNFAGSGGWGFYIYEGSTYTMANIVMAPTTTDFGGAPMFNDASAGGTITNFSIDLSGSEVDPGLAFTGAGTITLRYGYIKDSYGHMVQGANLVDTSLSIDAQFCVFHNWGLGLGLGPHPQPLQFIGNGQISATSQYNLFYVDNPDYGGLGISYGDNVESPSLALIADNHNVLIIRAGNVTGLYLVNLSQIDGPAAIENNFIDPTGITGEVFQFGGAGSITVSNNINMLTGDVIPPP
jgi:hypothetical protein